MANLSLHDELLNAQHKAILSFVEVLEMETSHNLQLTEFNQSTFWYCAKSHQEAGRGISKEKENASKLQVLEELQ